MSPHELLFALACMGMYVVLLSTMLRGSAARYPFLFAYLIVNLLSTVVQGSFKYYFGPRSREYVLAYWVSDFVGTFLILMIIIHLIRAAMERHKYRNAVYFGLLLGAVTTGVLSVVFTHSHSWDKMFRPLMTKVGRDYYFAAVLLNAILWIMLTKSWNPNKQLYLITSGLGLQLSGAAIAHALRVTHHFMSLGAYLLAPTYLLNLYVWYIALAQLPSEAPVVAGTEMPPAAAPQPKPTSFHYH